MELSQFDFNLPEELIAQTPLEKRSNSRLMVMDKITGEIEHKHFYDIIDYLNEGDALVINDTIETEWMKKSRVDDSFVIIDEENLMKVLKGEPYETYKRKLKNFTYRF